MPRLLYWDSVSVGVHGLVAQSKNKTLSIDLEEVTGFIYRSTRNMNTGYNYVGFNEVLVSHKVTNNTWTLMSEVVIYVNFELIFPKWAVTRMCPTAFESRRRRRKCRSEFSIESSPPHRGENTFGLKTHSWLDYKVTDSNQERLRLISIGSGPGVRYKELPFPTKIWTFNTCCSIRSHTIFLNCKAF
jgi:hypothetical protein